MIFVCVCVWVHLPPPGRLSGTSGPRFWPETQLGCCLSASAQPGTHQGSVSLPSFHQINLILKRNEKAGREEETSKGPNTMLNELYEWCGWPLVMSGQENFDFRAKRSAFLKSTELREVETMKQSALKLAR